MAVFSFLPDYGATADRQPRIRSIQFGDGYEQRQPDGINTLRNIWQVSFSNRDTSDIDDIEEFLIDHAGVDYFEWTPPRSSTQGKYICKRWQRTPVAGTLDTITAEFTEVFDL